MQIKPTLRKATELGIGLTALATLILAGCGGSGATANTTSATITPYKGPFNQGAIVTIRDANGNLITLTGGTVNASGVANVTFANTVAYPLLVEVTGSYYNEITRQSETTTVPLRSVVSSSSVAASVPVTIVTETAVADLQNQIGGGNFSTAHPMLAASAVTALNRAGTNFGVPASAVPSFNFATHQSSDANTIRLAALAVVANGQAGATLADRVKALARSMATLNAASAPTDVVGQTAFNNAITAMTSGASSVMAPGTTVPTAPTIITTTASATSSNATPAQTVTQMGGTKQGVALSLTGAVTTIAGSGTSGFVNATGTAALFAAPMGITTDGTNLYVAENTNQSIRKIVIATGAVTTVAGTGAVGYTNGTGTAAAFSSPYGITTDGTNLYVVDTFNQAIRKIVIATGVVSTLAGPDVASCTGTLGSSGFCPAGNIDGTGTAARFANSVGLTTDGTNLYVADTGNSSIRKIVIATGVVTTLAGNGTAGFVNGTGAAASFSNPFDITTDGTNLYVVDQNNYAIRKIVIATGVVTTLAGNGTAGYINGTGTAASFNTPYGITTDGVNLYVTEGTNYNGGAGVQGNQTIRKIVIATGVVSTVAGTGAVGFVNGTGTAAAFNDPWGITTDGTSLYVSDSTNRVIRKIQ